MTDIAERRNHPRYQAPSVQIMARSMGASDNDWLAGKLQAVDFNRYGMSLETDFPLLAGDQLNLTIEDDEQRSAHVIGEVRNRRRTVSGYRFGIAFEFQKNEKAASAAHEMLMFELQAVSAS